MPTPVRRRARVEARSGDRGNPRTDRGVQISKIGQAGAIPQDRTAIATRKIKRPEVDTGSVTRIPGGLSLMVPSLRTVTRT
jgi:hypothetical protein